MSSVFRVLIADDHELVRRGFRDVIREDPLFEIVAECSDGQEVLDALDPSEVDLAVVDLSMPKRSGIDVVREVHRRHLPVHVVILTMHKEKDFFVEALKFGVRGYVLKDQGVREIRDCLHRVAAGQIFISPSLSDELIDLVTNSGLPEILRPLTPAERKVLRLVGEKKTSREIADTLFISQRTVETHRHNICRKLGLNGYQALFQFALEQLRHL